MKKKLLLFTITFLLLGGALLGTLKFTSYACTSFANIWGGYDSNCPQGKYYYNYYYYCNYATGYHSNSLPTTCRAGYKPPTRNCLWTYNQGKTSLQLQCYPLARCREKMAASEVCVTKTPTLVTYH